MADTELTPVETAPSRRHVPAGGVAMYPMPGQPTNAATPVYYSGSPPEGAVPYVPGGHVPQPVPIPEGGVPYVPEGAVPQPVPIPEGAVPYVPGAPVPQPVPIPEGAIPYPYPQPVPIPEGAVPYPPPDGAAPYPVPIPEGAVPYPPPDGAAPYPVSIPAGAVPYPAGGGGTPDGPPARTAAVYQHDQETGDSSSEHEDSENKKDDGFAQFSEKSIRHSKYAFIYYTAQNKRQ